MWHMLLQLKRGIMTEIPIDEVVFDPEIYPRLHWSNATVEHYVGGLENGDEFPPITLEVDSNRLLDGKHRLEAHRKANRKKIKVVFKKIPVDIPAKLYAASLSATHGDRITKEEMKRIAEEIIDSNTNFSQATIAQYTGVSRSTISRWLGPVYEAKKKKEELEREERRVKVFLLSKAGWSQRNIAIKLDVSQNTVNGDVQMHTTDHLTEDQLRKAAGQMPWFLDSYKIIDEWVAEQKAIEPHTFITMAFAQKFKTAKPLVKSLYDLAVYYKDFADCQAEDHTCTQDHRDSIAEDLRRFAQQIAMAAEIVQDPSKATVSDEAIYAFMESE